VPPQPSVLNHRLSVFNFVEEQEGELHTGIHGLSAGHPVGRNCMLKSMGFWVTSVLWRTPMTAVEFL
jgi:hypothetical protein